MRPPHRSGLAQKKGKCRLFIDQQQDFNNIALTNLGKRGLSFNEQEEVDEGKENIRAGIAGEWK